MRHERSHDCLGFTNSSASWTTICRKLNITQGDISHQNHQAARHEYCNPSCIICIHVYSTQVMSEKVTSKRSVIKSTPLPAYPHLPPRPHTRCLSPAKLHNAHAEYDCYEKGIECPSKSAWSSPFHIVRSTMPGSPVTTTITNNLLSAEDSCYPLNTHLRGLLGQCGYILRSGPYPGIQSTGMILSFGRKN